MIIPNGVAIRRFPVPLLTICNYEAGVQIYNNAADWHYIAVRSTDHKPTLLAPTIMAGW